MSDEPLKGEGDVRTRVQKRVRRKCSNCGAPATHRVSYLLLNARSNPASKGYGKDDISWCSDDEEWSCEDCRRHVEANAPHGMEWGASFPGERFSHMVLHWETVHEETVPAAEAAAVKRASRGSRTR